MATKKHPEMMPGFAKYNHALTQPAACLARLSRNKGEGEAAGSGRGACRAGRAHLNPGGLRWGRNSEMRPKSGSLSTSSCATAVWGSPAELAPDLGVEQNGRESGRRG